MSGTVTAANSSYYTKIEGLNRIPAITMFAHAPKNELNHSNNKTYIKKSQVTGSVKLFSQAFYEDSQVAIKNIASSSYKGAEQTFKKLETPWKNLPNIEKHKNSVTNSEKL